MKKYITAALSIGTIALLFYTMFDLREQVKQVDVLQKQLDSVSVLKDSLYDVSFEAQVENGRYEVTFEHLKEVNPKAAPITPANTIIFHCDSKYEYHSLAFSSSSLRVISSFCVSICFIS